METKRKGCSHTGHRKRIIAKLETQTLCEHEILEVLLFNGVPRLNTNEIAHRLLAEFGCLDGIINAPMDALQRVEGVGESLAAYIRSFCLISQRWHSQVVGEGVPKKFAYDTFMPFLKRAYNDMPFEMLDAYTLDDAGNIVGRKRFSSSMFGKVEVEAQQLIRLIYAQDPTGIVLVHNHPHGEARPSKRDDFTTAQCQKICEENGVVFCDHLIYSKKGIYSYYLSGEMHKLSDLYENEYKNWMREFVRDENE